MTGSPILFSERRGRVAILRLNRPEKLNALSPELVDSLREAVVAAGRDEAVGCVLLTGAGRAFCAGGDLTAMLDMQGDAVAFRAYIERLQALALAFRRLDKPAVAAVHGHVLAGGFELALACDVRIAAEDARFGLPDTALGLSPTSGMTWLLPRVVGDAWARHLLLTGETIDVATARQIGLVTRVVPRDALADEALALAQIIAEHPPRGLAGIRAGLRRASEGAFEDALAAEVEAEVACFETAEFQASLRAFAARRHRPADGGAPA